MRDKTAAMVAKAPPLAVDQSLDRPTIVWRVAPPLALWDGPDFPELVVIPAGEFTMGSPEAELGRHPDESPLHRVRIGYALAVGEYPVTVGEFARFIADSDYDAGTTCKTYEGGAWDDHRAGRSWRDPGYPQTNDQPVVCVNAGDAQAYVAWISRKTGHAYRLLSEAEYEFANRAGTSTAYWWGDDIHGDHASCDACDNAVRPTATVPVGAFAPNPFGLYDTTGNAWSWVSDCYQPTYDGASMDGSAVTGGECSHHALRGGAWFYIQGSLRSAIRAKDPTTLRNYHNGFRVARVL